MVKSNRYKNKKKKKGGKQLPVCIRQCAKILEKANINQEKNKKAAAKKKQSKPKEKIQEVEHWDAELLKKAKYFTVVLLDGEKIEAKLIEMNKFNIQVETEKGVLLIPKHSIKYYILEEFSEEEE